jgi:hypothetical protein
MHKFSSINSFLVCVYFYGVRSKVHMRATWGIIILALIILILSPSFLVLCSIDEVIVPEVSLNTNLTETLQTDSIPAEGVRKEKSDPILGKSSKWLLIACTITVAVIVVLWGSSGPTNTNIDHYRDEHVFNLII